MSTFATFMQEDSRHLDPRNQKILEDRKRAREAIPGPRVGDYIRTLDGKLKRFSHNWDEAGLQVSTHGTFYFEPGGHMSFSGSLDPIIPLERIEDTGQTAYGTCWIFDNDRWGAGHGVEFDIPVRVYKEIEG